MDGETVSNQTILDVLGPTPEEAQFLHGIPEPERHEAWEKIFRDEKISDTENKAAMAAKDTDVEKV
jgi:hypothetical protein